MKYNAKRKASRTEIMHFQSVGFKVADSVTLYGAAISLVHNTALAIQSKKVHPNRIRRMVSEAKNRYPEQDAMGADQTDEKVYE